MYRKLCTPFVNQIETTNKMSDTALQNFATLQLVLPFGKKILVDIWKVCSVEKQKKLDFFEAEVY